MEPLSLTLMKVVEDLDWNKLLIILQTRLDMEYSPENRDELHNQSTSVKHIRNPSVFENFHILIKGCENTFANMYATLRWHSKYTNFFSTFPEILLNTKSHRLAAPFSPDQHPGFTFGKSETMDYGIERREKGFFGWTFQKELRGIKVKLKTHLRYLAIKQIILSPNLLLCVCVDEK